MDELITVTAGTALLNDEVSRDIAAFETAIKKIKAAEDNLKSAILEEMESKGILKIDSPELTINYIAPTDRETFDSKAFKKAQPDTYDEYVKLSPVKSSIRIKVK